MKAGEGSSAITDKEQRDAEQAKPALQRPLNQVWVHLL